jgi:hypothetical protein
MLNQELSAQIRQDLQDARMLLEQSGTQDERKKYRKAAEIILLKTLHLDPENAGARALLQSIRAAAPEQSREDVPFIVTPTRTGSPQKDVKKKFRLKLPFMLIAMLAAGGGILRIAQSHRLNPNALAAQAAQRARPRESDFRPVLSLTPQPVPVSSPVSSNVPAPPINPVPAPPINPVPAPPINPVPAPTPARQVLVVRAPAPPPIAISTAVGKLAVSSPIPAEIYAGDRYIGSTPTTLELPAGRQTLEYRHGDLRTAVSHEIKPDETATESITFSVTVQINAKPWAQVFLDGAQRRPLGQTPLSDISVPIGGVLVFENPNFPAKSYRITEKDAAIQVNFP